MKMLAKLLPGLLCQWSTNKELTEQVVLAFWEKVVGEPLARRTRPIQLHQSKLVVLVPSASWQRELYELQSEIVSRFNELMNRKIVALEFRVDSKLEQLYKEPSSAANVSPNVSPMVPISLPLEGIQDQELRVRLQMAVTSYLYHQQ